MGEVTNDSPDESRYHTVREGTMIPRARKSGESTGFDHNSANRVVVDPDQTGGGFEVDLPSLVKTDFFAAKSAEASAVENSSDFLKQMNDKLQEVQVQEQIEKEQVVELDRIEPRLTPRHNLGQPSPRSSEEELLQIVREQRQKIAEIESRRLAQESAKLEPTSFSGDVTAIKSGFVTANAANAVPLSDQYPYRLIQDHTRQVSEELAQQRELISTLILAQADRNGAVEKDVNPEKVDKVVVADSDRSEKAVATGIDFLDSTDDPIVPTYDVLFEMQLGTMAAKYHGVVIGDKCIALIYDTRFPYGNQYLPPAMGEEKIAVRVPKYGDNVYNCNSLGLHWTLGCLDVVILIKQ